MELEDGGIPGHYVIHSKIGEGGMGEVRFQTMTDDDAEHDNLFLLQTLSR